jgi:hypothetical protein
LISSVTVSFKERSCALRFSRGSAGSRVASSYIYSKYSIRGMQRVQKNDALNGLLLVGTFDGL